jgi:hypothetical protein
MSSKPNYALIIILSIAVIVLGVSVGFFYGQTLNFTEKTITNTQTITTISYSSQTVTSIVTVVKPQTISITVPMTITQTVTITPTIFENLEIINVITALNTNNYTITIGYKNLGSTDIIIENIFVNQMPLTAFWYTALVNGNPISNINVPQGSSGQLVITFPDEGGLKAFAPGVTVALKIQTASGFYYIGSFNMPGAFTGFEKLEISSVYANSATEVILNVKNTGSSDATITDIFINGKTLSTFNPAGTASPTLPISLATGASTTITITFASPGLVSGVTYDIKIHTASGTDYPKAVVIP